jgi:hypothetical protein
MEETMETTLKRGSNPVTVTVTGADGSVKQVINTSNLRTTAGASFQANQMSGTVAAVANYIAVTANATAAAAGDTTLTAEETTNGLARAAGTFAYNAGGPNYTLSKTFTYSGGSPITLAKAAMFNASSAGTMVFEAVFGSTATLVNGDQITVTWTVNI